MEYIRLADLEHKPADDSKEQFALDVLMGLSSNPKHLPPKYFYDTSGSEIFAKITDTEDYYPTRCEAEILTKDAARIAKVVGGADLNIVELGAGDGRKTKILLREFLKANFKIRYCPVDISESAIQNLINSLKIEFQDLKTLGIVSEYFDALRWLRDEKKGRNLVLFLGSNIGNFNEPQAQVFLRTMWNSLSQNDFLLLGFDLKKNIDVMLRAYNDSSGYTRSFNINLLKRMNQELGANFDLSKFDHFGTYNVKLGAMESFLLSLEYQEVFVKALNKKFIFLPFEAIHVEFSFKFLPAEIEDLIQDTGYQLIEKYTDSKNYFMDALVRVEKHL